MTELAPNEAAALDEDQPALVARVALVRPRTRGECADVPRPCPHRACRYHLANERATHAPGEPSETCALDVAERGGATLVEVGALMGVTRERIRQIEEKAIERFRRKLARLEEAEESRARFRMLTAKARAADPPSPRPVAPRAPASETPRARRGEDWRAPLIAAALERATRRVQTAR